MITSAIYAKLTALGANSSLRRIIALLSRTKHYLKASRRWLIGQTLATVGLFVICVLWVSLQPKQFISLWLTPDQQGQILFNMNYYQQAARAFDDPQWQAFSFYRQEQFAQAAMIYGQYDDIADKFAQANALAHGRDYFMARDVYQHLLKQAPEHQGAQQNLVLINNIINDIEQSSKSQQAEGGETSISLLKPQQKVNPKAQLPATEETAQWQADALLLDPQLRQMWLKQVRKNPARFLSAKFVMQLNQRKNQHAKQQSKHQSKQQSDVNEP